MSKLFTLLILAALTVAIAHSQILAIDYGTQFIKASLVHSGAGKSFSIVENPKSQRKFINSLGLYNQERFYEADTLTKRSRGPSNCFIYSHLLIDLHDNPSLIEVVKKDLILEYVKDSSTDQLLAQFVLAGFPEGENTVSLLETVAMMLKYVKLQAEKAAKGSLKDVVLIVPNHWNIHQRQFLVHAAELADLYVLSLIHENTAAAINYALSQRTTNNTEIVLFYNLGANSVQMTLAEFRLVKNDKTAKPIESIFILGDYGRKYVGGLKFDALIANFFAKKFEAKHKKTLSQRGMIRLLSESQRMKLVLSANKEATVFVEGIMDGIDFTAVINRRDFQEMAESTLKELASPIKRFLFDHDLKPEDLSGIQMIGGGSRIPRLQTLIGDAVDNKSLLGSHINGDEAMVLGAAFYGANSSKKFKVKGINLYDGFNFEMRLVLRNAQEDITEQDKRYYFKNVTLFKKKSRFGLTKQVSFKCKENLIVEIYKEDDSGLQLITRHTIDSIQDINETSYKVKLTFEINPISVVLLNDVKFTYEKEVVQSYTEKVRKYTPKPKKNKTEQQSEDNSEDKTLQKQKDEKQAKQAESQEDESEKQEKVEKPEQTEQADQTESSDQPQQTDKSEQDEPAAGQSQTTDQTENPDEKNQDSPKSNATKSQKKKKKREKIEYETVQKFKTVIKNFQKDLAYKSEFKLLNPEATNEMDASRKLFAKYEAQQNAKRRLAESKNKLETLIYEVRDKIEMDEFLKYSQKKEISRLQELVQEKGAWYEDTESNDFEDYRKEYKELNEPMEKIKKRIVEHRQRQEVRQRALGIIEEYTSLTNKIKKGKSWITDEEVDSLKQNLTQSKQRIENLYEKLVDVPINGDSVFYNKDMIKQTEIVKDQYFLLKGKPKPKGYKQPKEEKDEEQTKEKAEPTKQKDEEVNEQEL